MIGTNGKRESGKSVSVAWRDNDDVDGGDNLELKKNFSINA